VTGRWYNIEDKTAAARLAVVPARGSAVLGARRRRPPAVTTSPPPRGRSTRTVWRYFRFKEACVEPLLAKSPTGSSVVLDPLATPKLSLGQHMVRRRRRPSVLGTGSRRRDRRDAHRAMSKDEPALRTAYLMVHDGWNAASSR
jgi:hypothetical protein